MRLTAKRSCRRFCILLFGSVAFITTVVNLFLHTRLRHSIIVRYWACLLGFESLATVTRMTGKCTIFPLDVSTNAGYECLTMATKPSPWICINNPKEDRFVSGTIKDGGIWEEHIVHLFQELLRLDPNIAVIDIGANIGQLNKTSNMHEPKKKK